MEYKTIIEGIYQQINGINDQGKIISYIPELAEVDPANFGVHISTLSGLEYGIGDYQKKFSIQSIGKVFSLCIAYKMLGEKLWDRLGFEPSGTPFNSLVQLEADNGIPRNPFINSGAIVISDILISNLKNPREDFLEFIREIANIQDIHFSNEIAVSEKSVGYRNIAICNFIKSCGNLENDPEEVLDFYFDLCSLTMSCEELSRQFLFLANHGAKIADGSKILTVSQSKRLNALLQTCGFYDESGEFAFKVGLPGKSGVGGGIVAVHPDYYAIAVWSPKLNDKGNSYKGVRFLEEFTTKSELSIF